LAEAIGFHEVLLMALLIQNNKTIALYVDQNNDNNTG